jgi:hypothetical protein
MEMIRNYRIKHTFIVVVLSTKSVFKHKKKKHAVHNIHILAWDNSTFLCQKREVTRICLKILKPKTDQQSKHFTYSAVLTHGHAGKLPGGPMLIYVCCVQHVFFFYV